MEGFQAAIAYWTCCCDCNWASSKLYSIFPPPLQALQLKWPNCRQKPVLIASTAITVPFDAAFPGAAAAEQKCWGSTMEAPLAYLISSDFVTANISSFSCNADSTNRYGLKWVLTLSALCNRRYRDVRVMTARDVRRSYSFICRSHSSSDIWWVRSLYHICDGNQKISDLDEFDMHLNFWLAYINSPNVIYSYSDWA